MLKVKNFLIIVTKAEISYYEILYNNILLADSSKSTKFSFLTNN